jgi:hypothetical protein
MTIRSLLDSEDFRPVSFDDQRLQIARISIHCYIVNVTDLLTVCIDQSRITNTGLRTFL